MAHHRQDTARVDAKINATELCDIYLSRIEQRHWIDCPFDGFHEFHCAYTQLWNQIFLLANPYSMFPRACTERVRCA